MGWLFGQMRADFGFGTPAGPVWLRDNPFLVKAGRAKTRRQGLSLRLLAAVVVLGGLLLGGFSLEHSQSGAVAFLTNVIFGSSFPALLFVAVSFVHVLLIVNARTTWAVSLAEEARRGTLLDLLLSPLRRAEMLLAMGMGPARSAFLIALAGLPVYALLWQLGGPPVGTIACLYVVFALLSFQPPAYGVPALSGQGQTPDAPPGQFQALPNRRTARRVGYLGAGFPLLLGFLFLGQFLGTIGGGWLTHLFSALHLPVFSVFSFLIFFSWPYDVAHLLSDHLPFFHLTVSPLWYVLPLMVLYWSGLALTSAAALSAGDFAEMRRLPLWTRAQTVTRWTARAAGLCLLAVIWRAWVESGDTAGLAGGYASGPGWNAAGLLLLLGGFSLPNVYARAFSIDPRQKLSQELRSPALVLRRALRRSLRPLGVALGLFLAACALGGLSPFAVPVYQTAGSIALAGATTVVWAVGVRRVLPLKDKWLSNALLYGVPLLGLSVPGRGLFAALSPASAWVRLFAGGPALVSRFPLWHLGTLPSLWVCTAGPVLVGVALMAVTQKRRLSVPSKQTKLLPVKRVSVRNETQTAALMGWITAHTDNPIFTYEMRVRTRSGRWFDWLCYTPLVFIGTVALVLALPDLLSIFAFLSPFDFFNLHLNPTNPHWTASLLLTLASLLLLGQCYVLVLRGPAIGQDLIARDRQRGAWGFLLISPLTVRQIFWGKVFGQTAAIAALWAGAGLGCLALYGMAVPVVGLRPALGAWASGQVFVAALFTLGVSLGSVLATFPKMQKLARGLPTFLFVLIVGGSVYWQFQWVPAGRPGDWGLLMVRLLGGSLYALALAAVLFWLAEWRLARLRRRDIAFGDGLSD
jgi:hypothetical protein